MNEPIVIRATLPAWLSSSYSMESVMRYIGAGHQARAAATIHYYDGDMSKGATPWTLVGEADITVRLFSQDKLVASQMQTLQQELNAARAEWLTKQNEILERISKLQALTNEVAA